MHWQITIENHTKSQGYGMRTLVAFSGEANDPENQGEIFTEASANLSPGLNGRDMPPW